jgi:hypothetical protein
MKKCTKCGDEFEKESFPFVNKAIGKRYAMCVECKRQYDRDKWALQKDRRNPRKRETQKSLRDKRRNFIVGILKKSKCIDCSNQDWRVLEFDHRNPEQKEFNIADSVHLSEEKIQREIDKCDILCANCHRIRTIKQRNYYQNVV